MFFSGMFVVSYMNVIRIGTLDSFHIVDAHVGMVSIFHVEEIGSLFDVIGTTEENVDFFEGDLLRFWNKEINEDCHADVNSKEEEEGVLCMILI